MSKKGFSFVSAKCGNNATDNRIGGGGGGKRIVCVCVCVWGGGGVCVIIITSDLLNTLFAYEQLFCKWLIS